MGWSGSIGADSAVGSMITYMPDTTVGRAYTTGLFTAPKEGIYRFDVYGSGGGAGDGFVRPGGEGGKTVGYLHMKAGEGVYVGAGGYLSAAFVAKVSGAKLRDIEPGQLCFVAGAGGSGGGSWSNEANYYNNCSSGGAGGGLTGQRGQHASNGGGGGTQTAGGHSYAAAAGYGCGGDGGYYNDYDVSHRKGYGGDGYYGGGAGYSEMGSGHGGGGGSGYIHRESFRVGGKTYVNSTVQGGGAVSGGYGYVTVTYYARAQLPIVFNGAAIDQLIMNGTQVEHLIYNGTVLFVHRMKERMMAVKAWLHAQKPYVIKEAVV